MAAFGPAWGILIDSLPAPTLLLDARRRIVAVNPHCRQLFGGRELLGRALGELASGDEGDDEGAALEHIVLPSGGQTLALELAVPAAGGKRWLRMRLGSDGAGGAIAILEDLERERSAMSARERAAQEVESEQRYKGEILAHMSHEIRTPMNAIVGMTDLLRDTALTAEQSRYVAILRSAGEHLLGLVNDVLDLSRFESGRLSLEDVDFKPREAVEQTIELMLPRAREKRLDLQWRVSPQVPSLLCGDPQRLRQVLVNLLGNAIKYTETGAVKVLVEPDPNGADAGALLFSVEDSGVGVPEREREAIFESYRRLPDLTPGRPEGTGLGLAIARQLVQLFGGRIWVEGRAGGGSIFRFTARFAPASLGRDSSSSLNLLGLRVLAVACERTTRIVLREMLVDWGGEVVEAGSAEEALRTLAQPAGFAAAVLDGHGLDLPILELARRISARGDAAPSVILVTLDPIADADARKAGVSGRLLKPLRRRDLANALSVAMSGRQAWTSTESTLPPIAERALRILVVDDAPENRLLVEAYLKGQPHTLDFAQNGAEAVARFGERRYDVVLMDAQMPVMDGYAATRTMRQLEAERGRPPAQILALTADALPAHVEEALAAGCNSHLAKPLRRHALLVALSIAARATLQPSEPPSGDRVLIDPLIADLVPAFLDGRRRDLTAIDVSLADGDLEALAAIGHTIKGIAGSYGFRRVGELGAEIEAEARRGNLEPIRRCRAELAAHLARVEVVTRPG